MKDFLETHRELDLVYTYEKDQFSIASRVSQPILTSLPELSILTSSNGYWIHAAALYNIELSSDFSGVDLSFDTNYLPSEENNLKLYYSIDGGANWNSSLHISGLTNTIESNLVSQSLRWAGIEEFEGTQDLRFRLDLIGESVISSSYTSDISIKFLNPPSPPIQISATAGDESFELQFLPSSGSTSVNLYRSTQSGLTPENFSALENGTKVSGITSPFSALGLTNGTTYFLILTGVNAAGEGEQTEEFSVTPALSGDPVNGKSLIDSRGCLSCHGSSAPQFTGVTQRRTNEEIRLIILEGEGGMPSFSFSSSQLDDIIAYLSTL